MLLMMVFTDYLFTMVIKWYLRWYGWLFNGIDGITINDYLFTMVLMVIDCYRWLLMVNAGEGNSTVPRKKTCSINWNRHRRHAVG